MTEALRQLLRDRAQFRCEYCRMPERLLPFHAFEADHILPVKFGGVTEPDNLAWSCLSCNRHKGPLMAGLDPDTSQLTRLFNPRSDVRENHFAYRPPLMVGRTDIGRVTAWALAMNSEEYIELREVLAEFFQP
jgi:hypothetical protein